jgi:starch synthase (maltosyl-transferring)
MSSEFAMGMHQTELLPDLLTQESFDLSRIGGVKPTDGRSRVVIEDVTPQIDGGRHSVRRIVGDKMTVTAAIFADGHDRLAAQLHYRHKSDSQWNAVPMTAEENDLWSGSFSVDRIGSWTFTVVGWIDHFATWASDLKKRLTAQNDLNARVSPEDIRLALLSGAILVQEAAARARGADASQLTKLAASFNSIADKHAAYYDNPVTAEILALVNRYPDLSLATRFEPELPLWVDRERGRFSSWYELFPRSTSPNPGHHGTFRDVERQVSEIAGMGFDVLYLPPIHPIGHSFRKGPDNQALAGPDDPGSPWAIGDTSASQFSKGAKGETPMDKREGKHENEQENEGGHKSIHPQLGTFADFDRLIATTAAHGMEIALDIAFQCSPDHPWVAEHPNWFATRPDGSIQYAENPPKKYQDIYPLNFESPDWQSLWDELYSVFEFWIKRGVRIFRVDNPHTKALPFWKWCLEKLLDNYPETIFLAEAFTRPRLMYALAKAGFTQSYTYFTWRNTKAEIHSYLTEITQPPISEFFRPNLWPNTPDILHKSLQQGGRPVFMQRVVLAATLAANYGIYGPAYDLCENAPANPAPGATESEEYLHSEKYEIRQRDRNAPGTLVPFITLLNQIRHANPALQANRSLHFHAVDNSNLLCYSKSANEFESTILVAVNLDPFNKQAGWTDLDLDRLGIQSEEEFTVEDLLTTNRYTWRGRRNFIELRPDVCPAHVFRIVRQRDN